MSGDKGIRAARAAVVVAVAGFAAVQSYSHIYWLGHDHGQDRLDSALLPLSVDGLILAASLELLHAARGGRSAGRLAYFALWLGIGATIGANAAYGWPNGPLGIASSTWPALSFVLAVHVAMGAIKRVVAARTPPVPDVEAALNGHAAAAAGLFAADLEAGRVPGIRRIRSALHVGQDRAQQVQAYLSALAAGTAEHPAAPDAASDGAPVSAGQTVLRSPGRTPRKG